ncbi:MAG: hypothetical protein V7L14_12155 [Nostoc sp.]
MASTWEGDGFARRRHRGVVSPNFLPQGGTLVHGNELLSSIVPNYPAFGTYGISQHTIDVVLRVIAGESVNLPIDWTPPSGIQTAVDVFVGSFMGGHFDVKAILKKHYTLFSSSILSKSQ